ncbi:MAG TPA: diadenylate cyclase CdaA [Longimicrobiales bacterium]|nr:diadenylate cyclase CdaA [Longimicrobiales bacterium]
MNELSRLIGTLDWLDAIQIALVTAGVYYLLRLLARTGAIRILVGMLVFVALYFVSRALELSLIVYVLEHLFQYGAIAALIIFQPELRSGLARIGRARTFRFLNTLQQREVVDEMVEAVERLARGKVGAIIAVEREVKLEGYVETGTPLQASVESDLLVSIFSPYGPLHDGAVLISGDTIIGASVILPLTQFPVADKSLGTRHRAALGLSEETDALVVVVSEESSIVSVVQRGRIERGVDTERLRAVLNGAPLLRV